MFVKIDPQLRQSLQAFVQGRIANLRSWREFGLFSRLHPPPSLRHTQLRIRYNILYFASNYLLIFLAIFAITILRRPLLLFALAFAFVGSFYVWYNSTKPPMVVMGRTIQSHEQAFALVCICIPLLYMASAGSFAFWLLSLCGILTLVHAWAMDTSHAIYDEEELHREVRQQWGDQGVVIMSYIDKPTAALASLPIDRWLPGVANATNVSGEEDVMAQYSIENIRAAREQQAAASASSSQVGNETSSPAATVPNISMSSTSMDISAAHTSGKSIELLASKQIQSEENYARERKQLLGEHGVENEWREPPTIDINDLLLPLTTAEDNTPMNTKTLIDNPIMALTDDDIQDRTTVTIGSSSPIINREEELIDLTESGEELC